MDEDEFESLLDAALGIEKSDPETSKQSVGAGELSCLQQSQQQKQQQPDSKQAVAYRSAQPSPAASPVHKYPSYIPPGSPCWSDASMQMHASPPHDSSNTAAEGYDAYLLYSPVRETSSPPPEDQLSPVIHTAVQPADVVLAPQHQQHGQLDHTSQQVAADQPQQQAFLRNFRQTELCLAALPREVQMRVMCFMSADTLTTLAKTCQHFSSLCSEPVLWRRLFVHRWGRKVRHNNSSLSWKARYLERDAAELQAAGGGGGGQQPLDAMQAMFVQANLAKRHQALGRGSVDDLMLVDDDEVAAKVLAWRRSRGFVSEQATSSDTQGLGPQPQRPADLSMQPPLSKGSGHRAAVTGDGALGTGRRLVCRRPASGRSGRRSGGSSGSGGAAKADDTTAGAQVAFGTVAAGCSGGGGGGGSCGVLPGPRSGQSCQAAAAVRSFAEAPAAAGSGGSSMGSQGANELGSSPSQTALPIARASAASGNQGQQPVGHPAAAAVQSPRAVPGDICPPAAAAAVVAAAAAAGADVPAAAAGCGGEGAAPTKGATGSRRRSSSRRRWTQIGNVFCDELSGWVHVCDETCSEKIVEPSSGLLVCPISGVCYARLLTCAEEAEEEGDRDPDKEQREEEFGGERGRLARAFAEGYYCSDERELMRKCGVRLPR